MTTDRARYPRLSRARGKRRGARPRYGFLFELEPPVPELLSGVRCAAFAGDRVLMINTQEFGVSAFPGGTLEPGEDWARALERELL